MNMSIPLQYVSNCQLLAVPTCNSGAHTNERACMHQNVFRHGEGEERTGRESEVDRMGRGNMRGRETGREGEGGRGRGAGKVS